MATEQSNARTASTSSNCSNTDDAMRVGSTLRRWETPVFVAATLAALLHALDDAFLNRQPGVPLGQHALAALISVAAATVALLTSLEAAPVCAPRSPSSSASSRSSTGHSTSSRH